MTAADPLCPAFSNIDEQALLVRRGTHSTFEVRHPSNRPGSGKPLSRNLAAHPEAPKRFSLPCTRATNTSRAIDRAHRARPNNLERRHHVRGNALNTDHRGSSPASPLFASALLTCSSIQRWGIRFRPAIFTDGISPRCKASYSLDREILSTRLASLGLKKSGFVSIFCKFLCPAFSSIANDSSFLCGARELQ